MEPSSDSSPTIRYWSMAGGGQVDGNAFVIGIAKTRVDESGLNALPALSNSGVGHTDGDTIARRAGRVHVDFDIDQVSINAVNGGAAGFEQRHELVSLV